MPFVLDRSYAEQHGSNRPTVADAKQVLDERLVEVTAEAADAVEAISTPVVGSTVKPRGEELRGFHAHGSSKGSACPASRKGWP